MDSQASNSNTRDALILAQSCENSELLARLQQLTRTLDLYDDLCDRLDGRVAQCKVNGCTAYGLVANHFEDYTNCDYVTTCDMCCDDICDAHENERIASRSLAKNGRLIIMNVCPDCLHKPE